MSPRNPSFGPAHASHPPRELMRSFYLHCDELVEQEFQEALEGELQAVLLGLGGGEDEPWAW